MLTGMCSATSGHAAIFGYDISDPDQMAEIRKMTGICPQHNILFDELTPREHLRYFARIRASVKLFWYFSAAKLPNFRGLINIK